MGMVAICITYLGFVIEFNIPQHGEKWERQVLKVFEENFHGYITSKRTNGRHIQRIYLMADGHQTMRERKAIHYVVPTSNKALLKKEFGQLLREIVITSFVSLSKGKGICLHASSIQSGNMAVLFMGKSGSGKSTICKTLSGEYPPLTDDSTFILKKRGWQTAALPIFEKNIPLSKRTGSTVCTVASLCFLKQHTNNSITRIQMTPRAIKNILENILHTGADDEMDAINRLIKSGLPMYLIEFKRGKGIRALFREFIRDCAIRGPQYGKEVPVLKI